MLYIYFAWVELIGVSFGIANGDLRGGGPSDLRIGGRMGLPARVGAPHPLLHSPATGDDEFYWGISDGFRGLDLGRGKNTFIRRSRRYIKRWWANGFPRKSGGGPLHYCIRPLVY